MIKSQIIVTSRYLKSGSAKNKTKRKNYTKYIATRETVEVREQNKYDLNAKASVTGLCVLFCTKQILLFLQSMFSNFKLQRSPTRIPRRATARSMA